MTGTTTDLRDGCPSTIRTLPRFQTSNLPLALDEGRRPLISYPTRCSHNIYRICPGQFLAERTNFTFAAALLKAYDILPPPGETLPEEFVYKDAIIRFVLTSLSSYFMRFADMSVRFRRPESFRCQFRPRKMN